MPQYNEAVIIDGTQDEVQLQVQGTAGQTNALQTWENSADTLAQFTNDGRFQVGSMGTETDDALIEAHRDDDSSGLSGLPKRGFHSAGYVGGTLNSLVSWVVQELTLIGSGALDAMHETLRVRLTNQNTSEPTGGTKLQVGSFEAVNFGGDTDHRVPEMTGIHIGLTNEGYIGAAQGLKITLNNVIYQGIEDFYTIHAEEGIARVGNTLEITTPPTVPATPPGSSGDTIRIYPKSDGKLYAKNWHGTEYDLTGGGGSGAGVPTGTVISYAGAVAPQDWLLCDGQAISRTTYQGLWDVFRNGTTSSPFGNGDGATTFNLPNLCSRVPMGAGDGSNGLTIRSLGDILGEEQHLLTISEMPSHNHSVTRSTGSSGSASTLWGINNQTSSINSGNRGGDNPHNNIQPSIALNYIIKT